MPGREWVVLVCAFCGFSFLPQERVEGSRPCQLVGPPCAPSHPLGPLRPPPPFVLKQVLWPGPWSESIPCLLMAPNGGPQYHNPTNPLPSRSTPPARDTSGLQALKCAGLVGGYVCFCPRRPIHISSSPCLHHASRLSGPPSLLGPVVVLAWAGPK